MGNFLLHTICPTLGCVLTICMFASPLPLVTRVLKNEDLGEVNPVPWIAAFLNCFAYTVYAILREDYFIFIANVPGLLLTMYYTLSAISVLSQVDTSRNQSLLTFLKGAVLTGLLFWSVVGMFSGGLNHAAATSRIGIISAILSIAYYASPLSTAAMVIDKRDATSLYTPMITVNLLNAILWIFYGSLGIHQPQVWVPNAVGAALAISQLILVWIYPSRAEESQPLIQRNAAQVSPASFVRHKAEGVGKTFQQQPPQQQQT